MKLRMVCCLTVLLLAITATAQTPSRQDFRATSAKVLELARNGKWDDAISIGETQLGSSPPGSPGKNCRALMFYSLAFIFHQRADVQSVSIRRGWLVRVRSYEVLVLLDDH